MKGDIIGIKPSGCLVCDPGIVTAGVLAARLNKNGLYIGPPKLGMPATTAWAGLWMSAILGGGLGIESNISLFLCLLDCRVSSSVDLSTVLLLAIMLSMVNALLFLLIIGLHTMPAHLSRNSVGCWSGVFVRATLSWSTVEHTRGLGSFLNSAGSPTLQAAKNNWKLEFQTLLPI